MKHILFATALLVPSAVCGQDLRTATTVFAVAAASDWTATYHGISSGAFNEGNPTVAWAQGRPALMVAAGVAEDVALALAWRRLVGRRHPRVAAVGLYAAAGFRVYLAAKGVRYIRESR